MHRGPSRPDGGEHRACEKERLQSQHPPYGGDNGGVLMGGWGGVGMGWGGEGEGGGAASSGRRT